MFKMPHKNDARLFQKLFWKFLGLKPHILTFWWKTF